MQVFSNRESIGALTKTGNTTVQLAASVITLGAKQYNTSTLSCDLSTSGAGGLDTGSLNLRSVYYIYAILDGSTVKLIASLNDAAPSGFTVFKRIGGLSTDYQSVIEQVSKVRLEFQNVYTAFFNNGGTLIDSDFPSGLITNSNGGTGHWIIDYSNLGLTVLPWADVVSERAGSGTNFNIHKAIETSSIGLTSCIVRTGFSTDGRSFTTAASYEIKIQIRVLGADKRAPINL